MKGDNEEIKSDKLAYYSKLYSGSHAKIPLPTANSIIPKKYQSRQKHYINHQEIFSTDSKAVLNTKEDYFDDDGTELELRRFIPPRVENENKDDRGNLSHDFDVLRDSLNDHPLIMQHILTPGPHMPEDHSSFMMIRNA